MKTILLILFTTISISVMAQNSPQDILDEFFRTYEKDAGKAVQDLYKTNVWTERIKDDIDKIVNTVNGFTTSYMGAYYGHELITTKKLSDSFSLYSYIVKYDRQPVRFIFKFYKPNDKWVLYAFQLDDSIDDEIEEAAKLHYVLWENNN